MSTDDENPPGWRQTVADLEGSPPSVIEMKITVGRRQHIETVSVLILPDGTIQRWGASLPAIRTTVEFTECVRDAWLDHTRKSP